MKQTKSENQDRQSWQLHLWELMAGSLVLGLPPALLRCMEPQLSLEALGKKASPIELVVLLGLILGAVFIFEDRLQEPRKRASAWATGLTCSAGIIVGFSTAFFMTRQVFFEDLLNTAPKEIVWLLWILLIGAWALAAVGTYCVCQARKDWNQK